MKGKLHRTDGNWTVTYITSSAVENGRWVSIAELPLHPSNLSAVSTTYVNDEYETVYIYDGKNIEFEIVEKYAKFINI
jgi:hypothetical protein